MKTFTFALLTMLMLSNTSLANDKMLEDYIKSYDYDARLEMKSSSKKLIDLLEDGKAVLVDIRFKEEQQAWGPRPAVLL